MAAYESEYPVTNFAKLIRIAKELRAKINYYFIYFIYYEDLPNQYLTNISKKIKRKKFII